MKLLEYQGKAVFAEAGITVPASRLVTVEPGGTKQALRERTAEAARELSAEGADGADGAEGAEGNRHGVVVKAQVTTGGRGKAGLIKTAGSPEEAGEAAEAILSRDATVRALLVEEMVSIERELYLSISVDAPSARFLILASASGGVEIETLALEAPETVKRVEVDPFFGLQAYQSRGLAFDLGLSGDTAKQFAKVVGALYEVFRSRDAELAEINPLFVTSSGRLVAGDSKLIIDDNSLDRQKEFEVTREQFGTETEYAAALEGIPYVQFEGDISLMCAGAGLTTTVYDLVQFEGGTVANYLEFGGPNYRKARRAMELCLENQSKVILIVTFGTIARADVMAEGIVEAIAELKPDRPIVTCIRGTNEESATQTLRDAGIEPLLDTEEAVRTAVAIAKGERQ